MFSCGQFGCHVENIDDAIMKKSMDMTEHWARRQHQLRGDFPPMVEQADYLTYLYARLTQIKIA